MRRLALACVLVFASLAPLATASFVSDDPSSQRVERATDGFGAPLSDDLEAAPLTYGYSPAVRAAFARVSNLEQYSEVQLASAKQWVAVSKSPIGEPAKDLKNTWIIDIDPHRAPSHFADLQRQGIIEVAYPLVEKNYAPKWTPNDPKFSDQWHLYNSGQTGGTSGEDANVTGAWNSVNGSGVVIGIVDDGLDYDHPDLDDYYESTLDYDYCGNDGNPAPSNWDAHGTAAAGVAAAVGNNSLGVTGAAPAAGLAGLRLISCSLTDTRESGALSHERQSIDIYSNSWGPGDDGRTLEAPGPLTMAAFEADAYTGRGGLGNIITWAAGNGLSNDDDSNYDGYANSRWTIAVAASTHYGDNAYYSEPGDNILVAAPSDGDGEGITTTDIEGSSGYTNNDYTDNFGGTSSATPLVSGVVALMLEANANLTWRDVQHILANSARVNDAGDWSWNTNGAGHDVSHKYGFGVVDAGAAVSLAQNWTTVGPEMNVTSGTQNIGATIPDNTGTAVQRTINISDDILLESVDILVDISHSARGDLEISLVSPSGTTSTLATEHNDNGNNYADWMFSSVHFWDEPSRGNWTLYVEDASNGDSGTWDSWELILHGTELHRDSDSDGLLDDDETDTYGTDPDDNDTDDDFLLDGFEIFNSSTDPLNPDSDYDGLLDGIEVLINGTDPLDNDTDDDGLLDGYEVSVTFTDPLTYDNDSDNDTWYWFEDCNDEDYLVYPGAYETLDGIDNNCDEQIDEGFNESDIDFDGLSDWSEYHVYNTSYTMWDTDWDGLSDGDELLNWSSDPLTYDNDTDSDGWYWFADCDDENASLFPNNPEILDGVDNDCDDQIDEDFYGLDSDGDLLFDLDEFNLIGTDPFDNDTDNDGLLDGEELLVTHTDPMWPDLDEDGDGYRWFADCDDNDSARSPDAVEIWNWIDDDCDGDIDEDVNRLAHLTSLPEQDAGNLTVNLTHQPFEMAVWLVNVSFDIEELLNHSEVTWTLQWPDSHTTDREGRIADDGDNSDGMYASEVFASHISTLDCSEPLGYDALEQWLCVLHNETVTGWVLTFHLVDQGEEVTLSTNLSFTIWNPPPPVVEPDPEPENGGEGESGVDNSSGLGVGGSMIPTWVLGVLGGILILSLLFLLASRRRPPKHSGQLIMPIHRL